MVFCKCQDNQIIVKIKIKFKLFQILNQMIKKYNIHIIKQF